MKPVTNETIIEQLNWRYAVKQFDATKKVSAADWKTLEETLVLSPSSFGLQPWKFIVITNQAKKDELVAASWGQKQVAEASHLVVFAVKKNVDAAWVDRFIDRTAEVRKVPKESMAGYQKIMTDYVQMPKEKVDVNAWSARQVYIALGQYMTTAAMLGIDTCPMEGIDTAQYDKALGLDKEGYSALCVCPAGYRSADDKYGTLAKVRFEAAQVITHID